MVAEMASLPALLDSLTQSLNSALEAAPKVAAVEHSTNGLSLLDAKNDILLSYLQNLVFLILLKIRNAKQSIREDNEEYRGLDALVVKKLVELRVYLDRGVRPLEDKLRYQIDKILRAADDSERNTQAIQLVKRAKVRSATEDAADSASEDGDSENEEDVEATPAALSELQARPNLSSFVKPESAVSAAIGKESSGVYRPPRFAPTVMPTTERREKAGQKPLKSRTMDEFIANEWSTAPVAEPSIGTTIIAGGRKVKTDSERREETRRREYEETNFVRLPKESKKDKAQKAKTEGRTGRMTFGGEDWRDLGEGVDRIARLTKGKSSGGGTRALLEKSRKRGRDTVDGPRGSGVEMGERFQKRAKVLEGGRRDRGKR